MSAYLIWWTAQADWERVEELGLAGLLDGWPEYLRSEFGSRCGRAGRGRLWAAAEFPCDICVSLWPDTAIGKIAENAGGIIIHALDVWHVLALPGFVTTLDMHMYRLSAQETT